MQIGAFHVEPDAQSTQQTETKAKWITLQFGLLLESTFVFFFLGELQLDWLLKHHYHPIWLCSSERGSERKGKDRNYMEWHGRCADDTRDNSVYGRVVSENWWLNKKHVTFLKRIVRSTAPANYVHNPGFHSLLYTQLIIWVFIARAKCLFSHATANAFKCMLLGLTHICCFYGAVSILGFTFAIWRNGNRSWMEH